MKTELTYDRANELLRYDAETGRLYWRVNRRGGVKAGDEAGCIAYINGRDKTPYRVVGIDGVRYKAHRVAWLLHRGEWPKYEIDHCDGDGLNNRLGNMRDVTKSVNQRNSRMRSNNTSGVIGVYWHKPSGKWRAQAKVDGKQKYVGLFSDKEKAEAAVKDRRSQHGFTERHGLS